MSSAPSSIPPKPLPKNRAVLEVLFKLSDLCFQRARNVIHRSQQKLRLLNDFGDGKITFAELSARNREIDDTQKRDKDGTLAEIDTLWPYCEIELLQAAGDHMSQGGMAVAGLTVADETMANQWLKSCIELLQGQRLHAIALLRLRERIFQALEGRARTRARTRRLFWQKSNRVKGISQYFIESSCGKKSWSERKCRSHLTLRTGNVNAPVVCCAACAAFGNVSRTAI